MKRIDTMFESIRTLSLSPLSFDEYVIILKLTRTSDRKRTDVIRGSNTISSIANEQQIVRVCIHVYQRYSSRDETKNIDSTRAESTVEIIISFFLFCFVDMKNFSLVRIVFALI
jgi:hypothetical protein